MSARVLLSSVACSQAPHVRAGFQLPTDVSLVFMVFLRKTSPYSKPVCVPWSAHSGGFSSSIPLLPYLFPSPIAAAAPLDDCYLWTLCKFCLPESAGGCWVLSERKARLAVSWEVAPCFLLPLLSFTFFAVLQDQAGAEAEGQMMANKRTQTYLQSILLRRQYSLSTY